MLVNLNNDDVLEFKRLNEIMKYNTMFLNIVSNYINFHDIEINDKLIKRFKKEVNVNNKEAFYHLFYSFFIDELKEKDKEVMDSYLRKSLTCLKINDYFNNHYNLRINATNKKYKNWAFKNDSFKSFQGFIFGETQVDEINYFLETPSFGFFEKQYSYLAVLENNREWMTITPNEMNTMKEPIEKALGNVLTIGLGLGYFAYMTSLKENVNKVTIIEKDSNVIELFKETILPSFEFKEKIEIINEDAFTFLQHNNLHEYNYVFVDIWHDVSDGLFLYLDFKAIEDEYQVSFNYWIENEILLLLRKIILRLINESYSQIDSLNVDTSNKQLDEVYKRIYHLLNNIQITSYYDIYKLLKKDNLQILAKYINRR